MYRTVIEGRSTGYKIESFLKAVGNKVRQRDDMMLIHIQEKKKIPEEMNDAQEIYL